MITKEDLSEMPLPVRLQMTKDLLQSMMDEFYMGKVKFANNAERDRAEIHLNEAIRQLRFGYSMMKPYIQE